MLRVHANDMAMPRPTLVTSRAMATALQGLAPIAESRADLWRLMVDNFTVDLDALAAILPLDDPEPGWLVPRA